MFVLGLQRITAVVRSWSAREYCKSLAIAGRLTMECTPDSKVAKKTVYIGTHDGKFHCDEVLACYMLCSLPEYRDAEIKRSRDPAVLDECDIVVDVGGVYDPSIHRYDHHQKWVTVGICRSLQVILSGHLQQACLR